MEWTIFILLLLAEGAIWFSGPLVRSLAWLFSMMKEAWGFDEPGKNLRKMVEHNRRLEETNNDAHSQFR